jgi:hypothetical protein
LRDEDKINRQAFYMTAPALTDETYPKLNNRFKYHRAPEGYKFLLESVYVVCTREDSMTSGVFELSDGHYWTGWNVFPGVENREVLAYNSFWSDQMNFAQSLHQWECKEYTLAIRSTSASNSFRVCIIVFYYLRKMSKLETLMYACVHPLRKRFRKGYATTVELDEQSD